MTRAEEIGVRLLSTLRMQAARNRLTAERLRCKIRDVLSAHGTDLTADRVIELLECHPPPALRSVQRHLKIIRATSSV